MQGYGSWEAEFGCKGVEPFDKAKSVHDEYTNFREHSLSKSWSLESEVVQSTANQVERFLSFSNHDLGNSAVAANQVVAMTRKVGI